MNRNDQI